MPPCGRCCARTAALSTRPSNHSRTCLQRSKSSPTRRTLPQPLPPSRPLGTHRYTADGRARRLVQSASFHPPLACQVLARWDGSERLVCLTAGQRRLDHVPRVPSAVDWLATHACVLRLAAHPRYAAAAHSPASILWHPPQASASILSACNQHAMQSACNAISMQSPPTLLPPASGLRLDPRAASRAAGTRALPSLSDGDHSRRSRRSHRSRRRLRAHGRQGAAEAPGLLGW